MTAEREITVSRTIRGPVALVFEAYTDVAHLAHWWGPDGFTTTTKSFAFHVGGIWDFTMHGPDGVDHPNWIRWREIVRPERIVLEHGRHAGDPDAFVSTVTFVANGKHTDVTMCALFPTKEARDHAVLRYGAIEGGKQTLGRLDQWVSARAQEAT